MAFQFRGQPPLAAPGKTRRPRPASSWTPARAAAAGPVRVRAGAARAGPGRRGIRPARDPEAWRRGREPLGGRGAAGRGAAPEPAPGDPVLVQEPEERPGLLPGGRFFSVTVMVCVFILCLFVLIGLQIRHNSLGREVSALTSGRAALVEENRHLRAEMFSITVLDDLEYVAQELGLVTPGQGQIVVVD
ncbi:MAG: hypothetical protein LBP95_06260 [Deltaproteobacteria bacterium]|jgi:hypothetical protein|nr:hypothetical protein [Deltaproteobacteria bacterium]